MSQPTLTTGLLPAAALSPMLPMLPSVPRTAKARNCIFIKSYPKDYRFLTHCLRSIQRHAFGFHEIVVALPVGESLPLTKERVVNVPEFGNGYYRQMAVKLQADRYTDCEFIVFLDSDCVLTRDFFASELFDHGAPKLLRRRWDEAGDGICWKEPADKALGFETEYDTMCCHPSIYRRDTLQRLRAHMEALHGMPLDQYVLEQERFIEFVTVGNFALTKEPELYSIIEYGPNDCFPRPLRQFWSHGGFTPEVTEELKQIELESA